MLSPTLITACVSAPMRLPRGMLMVGSQATRGREKNREVEIEREKRR